MIFFTIIQMWHLIKLNKHWIPLVKKDKVLIKWNIQIYLNNILWLNKYILKLSWVILIGQLDQVSFDH
jgi:hypothetical protein